MSVSSSRIAAVNAAQQATVNAGQPLSHFEPPNLNAPVYPASETAGHVIPLYASPPAPMGIADFGLRNTTGTITPYILNTTSVEATFTTTDPWGVQSQYLDFGTQTQYGAQLNVVLVNTTLFGNNGTANPIQGGQTYSFWLQNVINYNPEAASSQLSFFDNIWNFSNPAFTFPNGASTNGILHGSGSNNGEYYGTSGISVTVTYPFSLALYLNTTVSYTSAYSPSCATSGCDEVYFNYSVWNGAGASVTHGSYDNVYFHSPRTTGASTKIYPGSAQIESNGFNYNPAGLTTDMEMDWGIGTSSGASAQTVYANATLGIFYALPTSACGTHPTGTNCKYVSIPAAWNFGADTGETGLGSHGWWGLSGQGGVSRVPTIPNGDPVARMTTGPSFLSGLWNASASPIGAYRLNYQNVFPGNAWIGVALGSNVQNLSYYGVATTFGWFTPRGLIGPNIYLSPGNYTVLIQLSGYDQYQTTINLLHGNVNLSVALTRDPSSSIYTPLYAYSSSDLANLSSSGAGTSASPYVIASTQQGTASLSWLFAGVNDYMFPVWMGVYLNATTAYVVFNPLPSALMVYPVWQWAALQKFNSPLENQYQIYDYHASNVAFTHGHSIGGWTSTSGGSNYVSRQYTVIVNDGTDVLLADNNFNVSVYGAEFTGGGSNGWVWGNSFTPWVNPGYGLYAASTGLVVSESGVHVYNNEFYTNGTASSSSSYTNFWNVTTQPGSPIGTAPTSYSVTVMGFALTGTNILGQNYQGGNYWFNYGMHADPYGLLPYIARASNPTATGSIGKVGTGDFAPLTTYGRIGAGLYPVTFTETGIATGGNPIASWAMRLSNVPVYSPFTGVTTLVQNIVNTTTTATDTFWVPNGTVNWALYTIPAARYLAVTTGSVTVAGASAGVSLTFQFAYAVTFTETGMATPIRWYFNVTGQPSVTSTATTIAITLPNGTSPTGFYTYALATGSKIYKTTSATGSFNVTGATVARTIPYTAVTFTVSFAETGLPGGTNWYVNGTSQTAASSTTTSLSASFTNGTIAYTVATSNKLYAVAPIHYSIVIAGGPATGPTFAFALFTTNAVTFTETGLTTGIGWAVTLNGVIKGSTGTTVVFASVNGTFSYAVSVISGETASPSSGTVTVHGTTAGATITFSGSAYAVTFTEVGLVSGTSWSVTLNSVVHTSTTNTIAFSEAPGTYSYTVGAIAGTSASPSSGSVTVTSAAVNVPVTYSTVMYTVSFTQGGTYAGAWAVQFGGALKGATSGTISFTVPNGTYAYMVASVAGYTAAPSSGSITVAGSGSSTSITFSTAAAATYSLQFTENGLVAGTSWSVTVTGQGTLSSTGSTITFSGLVAGAYTYSYGAVVGYTTPSGSSTTITAASVSIGVTYSAPTFAVTFTESGLPSGTVWAVAFAGQITVSTGTSIVFHMAAGTYSYSVATTSGYAPSPASGALTVSGATPVSITYTLIPPVPTALSAGTPVAVSGRPD